MTNSDSSVRILTAKTIHTMEPDHARVEAVAVQGERIVAVGSMVEVEAAVHGRDITYDTTFADHVLVPGLIDQHLHPLLAATTLTTSVIATEDWELPSVTYRAAHSHDEYMQRLGEAHQRKVDAGDENGWMFSWGYHSQWHGELSRDLLDSISDVRPIAVWQRSCHEWFLNSQALTALGCDQEWLDAKASDPTKTESQRQAVAMVDLDRGHFWESGMMMVMTKIAPKLITPERMTEGLHLMVEYLHQNGVTAFNEPGISWKVEPWELYTEILGADDVPFTSTFMVDGRNHAVMGKPVDQVIADADSQVQRAPAGKVRLLDKHVKFFADGAIISQLMQMNDPYLDAQGNPNPNHHGEWMVDPEAFATYVKLYWDAGWQIHTHVNGDKGLDMVLDTLESCMADTPRDDHRSVLVHFANSTEEQVDRIARLGAIVSANSYYPCGFADKFGEVGLGPERADVMVRNASVLARDIPLSFHSDMPMAPSAPLKLAGYAVDRITQSGRVAGPEQRISRFEALRAVTIGAAYSWRQEHDLGSIAVGKLANFSVLTEDPLDEASGPMGSIGVEGVVYEGRWFPLPDHLRHSPVAATTGSIRPKLQLLPGHDHTDHGGCSCDVAHAISHWYQANIA